MNEENLMENFSISELAEWQDWRHQSRDSGSMDCGG